MQKKKHNQEPTVAPGINDAEELDRVATETEVEAGDYTSVTTFSWDEVDPSDD